MRVRSISPARWQVNSCVRYKSFPPEFYGMKHVLPFICWGEKGCGRSPAGLPMLFVMFCEGCII